MGREPVSEDELGRAKALTEADELGALQRVDEKADRLSMYTTLFNDPGMVNSILPRYLSTTAEQIQAVCRSVFVPDNRVVLTYVPAAAAADPAAGAASGSSAE
jgi:predicted Zn-dependent peptidase